MIYVSDERGEMVRAHFTYFGFRYVRVTGWPGDARAGDFTGRVVYSDLDDAMRLDRGQEKLNRLAKNVFWGQRSVPPISHKKRSLGADRARAASDRDGEDAGTTDRLQSRMRRNTHERSSGDF